MRVSAEKHRCKRNCKCAKLGKDCHPISCGCKGRRNPAINARGISVGGGLGVVMANEVKSGHDSRHEAKASEGGDCESHCSTSSWKSCASDGDGEPECSGMVLDGRCMREWRTDRYDTNRLGDANFSQKSSAAVFLRFLSFSYRYIHRSCKK